MSIADDLELVGNALRHLPDKQCDDATCLACARMKDEKLALLLAQGRIARAILNYEASDAVSRAVT